MNESARDVLIRKIKAFVDSPYSMNSEIFPQQEGYLFLHIQEDVMVQKTKEIHEKNPWTINILDEFDYVFFKETVPCEDFKNWLSCPVCLKRCNIICLKLTREMSLEFVEKYSKLDIAEE